MPAGFLSAFSDACTALAAALGRSKVVDVPSHTAELASMLMWTWSAALKMFDDLAEALADPSMKPLLLPATQLAVAGA
jgi:hypothetical protein